MAILVSGATKRFEARSPRPSVSVLENIDLEALDGRIVSLFGPNGCGKTTLLNIMAGIEELSSGELRVLGQRLGRPQVALLMQGFREVLLPWYTVLDNVSFGLRALRVSSQEARQCASDFLAEHAPTVPLGNYPYQLSVGQQQIVALARTLVVGAPNVLFDEPFSALDHTTRFRMQALVSTIAADQGAAIVFVSHDIDEALYVSDELYLLSRRPARVLRRFPVPFSRPRTRELLTSAEFSDLRREVVGAFLEEVSE